MSREGVGRTNRHLFRGALVRFDRTPSRAEKPRSPPGCDYAGGERVRLLTARPAGFAGCWL